MTSLNPWFCLLFFVLLTLRRKHLLRRLRRVNRVRGFVLGPPASEWKLPVLVGMVMLSTLNLGWSWEQPSVARAQTQPTSQPEVQTTRIPETTTLRPTNTYTPTLVPAPTFAPTPTPLPIPKTGVIWDPDQAGVYFWQDPGQGLLAQIPNSEVVTFLEEWEPYGGQAWAHVAWAGQPGWVEASRVWRVTMPEHFPVVQKGAYLYAIPDGKPLTWLPAGTPLRLRIGSVPPVTPNGIKVVGENDASWVQVTLLDGSIGWVREDNLIQRK